MITTFLLLSLASAKAKPAPLPAKPPAALTTDEDQDIDAPAENAGPAFHWKPGPAKIALGHELSMSLPDTDVFLAPPEAGKLMEKMGNLHNENLLGLVMGKDDTQNWIVTIRYFDEGFIADDDKLDADEIFKTIKDGTEEGNQERQEKGFQPLHIQSWTEPPRYEKDMHHLVWGLLAKSDDPKDTGTINFNTRVLGRKGYASLNLLTEPTNIATDKPSVAALLAATSFDSGSRYEDFNKSTDKKAEYGLAGLILGGGGLMMAAKVGLFSKFFGILLAAKKLVILGIAAAAAWFRKLFGKKNPVALPPTPPPAA